MGGDKAGSVREEVLTIRPVSLETAPRRIAELCGLPRTLLYRLALTAGLEWDETITEKEFLTLPAIQQASVLARLLKEYDAGKKDQAR
jgi:hypothetical protein